MNGTKYDNFNIFPKHLHMIPETPLSSTELQIVAISELLHIFWTCTLLISVGMQPKENCWWSRENLFVVISPWICIRNNLLYTIDDRFGFIHVQGPMTKGSLFFPMTIQTKYTWSQMVILKFASSWNSLYRMTNFRMRS